MSNRLLLLTNPIFLILFFNIFPLLYCFIWPIYGSIAYITILLLFEFTIMLFSTTELPKYNYLDLDKAKYECFKHFVLYFKYPVGCIFYSSTISRIQVVNIIIIIMLLCTKHFILAVIYFANLFILGKLSRFLNPIFFLERDIKSETNPLKKLKKQVVLALILATEKEIYTKKVSKNECEPIATN